MNRIKQKFKALSAARKKAFIAFITAGYPSLAVTRALIMAFEKRGVDIIELGVPFSDPFADGPIIQEASQEALKKNTDVRGILDVVRDARSAGVSVPICLMSYYNPVFCYGTGKFARDAVAAGVDGVIIPDLPPDEGVLFMRQARTAGLDTICFVTPTSTPQRIAYITRVARGFVYYVSLTGVTGPRQSLPPDMRANIAAIKRRTALPVCAGFGVSTRQQVKDVQAIADGVIVGSAIVARIKKHMGRGDLVRRVAAFTADLKGSARGE